jgi:hypothetical protein
MNGNDPEVPHVAYHGSDKDVKKFNTALGAWFTDKPALANEYASKDSGNVYPVHLAIKNPIKFVHAEQRKKIGEVISHALNGMGDLAPEQINKAQFLIDQLRQTHGNEPKALFEFWRNDPNIAEFFRTLGYDGISAFEKADRKTKTWAVLNPEQVKSAIGNEGTFDPSNPDITKAEGGEVDEPGITAYHGSPHDFPQFDLSKIGTGEGNQSYGHGLYFAQNEDVAKGYRNKLSEGTYKTDTGEIFDPYKNLEHLNIRVAAYKGIDPAIDRARGLLQDNPDDDRIHRDLKKLYALKEQNAAPHKGHMYEVNIKAHPDHFLDWDKPFQEQSAYVQKALMGVPNFEEMGHYKSGLSMGSLIEKGLIPHTYDKASPEFSKAYHAAGIKGVRYLDAGSRPDGAYALHISHRGKPYADPIPMKTFQQAQNHAKEYTAKGYDAEIKENGSRNYVVFDDKLVNVKRKYAKGGTVQRSPKPVSDGSIVNRALMLTSKKA